MTAAISAFFATVFGKHIILATIIIAMLPLIELRGAIMFASSSALWGEITLSPWLAYLVSFIGSSLVVPLIALLFTPIIRWLKKTKLFKKLGNAIYNRVNEKSSKIQEDCKNLNTNDNILASEKVKKLKWKKMIGIFAFVAVPLPLTGVWTGTAIAVVLGMSFWDTMLAVISGNAIAGLIITLLTLILGDKSIYGLYAFLILIVIFVLVSIIVSLVKRKKKQKLAAVENKENQVAEDVIEK